MDHIEFLITERVYEIISWLWNIFPMLSGIDLYSSVDIDQVANEKVLVLKVELPRQFKMVINEKYSYQDYHLKIFHYHYMLLDPQEGSVISFDNSPHYPELDNFPHHKHYYPKDEHSPVSFSGSLLDALKEIKWVTNKS
jgi:hypothetical protein